jgi:hypothetical protein
VLNSAQFTNNTSVSILTRTRARNNTLFSKKIPVSQTAHVVFRGITHDKRKELEKVVGRIDAKVYTKAKQQVPEVAAMILFYHFRKTLRISP